MDSIQTWVVRLLRWSEKYTKTDMVYLAQGSFWLILGQILSASTALGAAIFFGHAATQDTYGNFKYILSLAGLFAAFSLTGVGTSVTQATARGKEGVLSQGFRLSLKWSIGIAIASLGTAAYYYFIDHNNFTATSLLIVALLVPLINSFSLYDPFLVGKREFGRDTIYSFLVYTLPTVAVILSFLFISQRAIVMVASYLVTQTIVSGLLYLNTLRLAQNHTEDPEMLSYSKHLSVMGLVNVIADKIDSIAIFTFLGPAQLAIYSYAIAMPEQIKALIKMIVPLSIGKYAERTMEEIQGSIHRRLTLLFAVILVTVLLYIVAAPYLFALLIPVYMDAVGYSRLYALSLIFGFTTPLFSILQAHKNTRVLYRVTNTSALFLIIATPILAYSYGILGAILVQMGSRALVAALVLIPFLGKGLTETEHKR